jgi:hypothetical protein
LHDLGEAVRVALDRVRCGLRNLLDRAHTVRAPAGRIADSLDERQRTESDPAVVASEPGPATRNQAVGAGKEDGHGGLQERNCRSDNMFARTFPIQGGPTVSEAFFD